MNYLHKKQGFTLIELLVVIAIIGVLMAYSVANFLGARQRAKDVKIKAELTQLKNALRLFYNDYNNYPGPSASASTNTFNGCGTTADGTPSADCASASTCPGQFASGPDGDTCQTVYMKQIPPATDYTFYYQQQDSGNDFCLWSHITNTSDPAIASSQVKCNTICGAIADISSNPTDSFVLCAD